MNKEGRHKDGKYKKGREVPQEEKEKIAQALQGNTNRLKIKTEDLQQVAYAAYCNWLAMGRDKKGYVFDYEDENGVVGSVTYLTIENYVKSQRFKLDPSQQDRAEALSYQCWEAVGIQMMKGEMEKCQPAIYQMMMRNKFGWDKDTKTSNVNESDAKKFMQFCDSVPQPPKASGFC
jgi:hypothetical protein